jgi:hypothetical protein
MRARRSVVARRRRGAKSPPEITRWTLSSHEPRWKVRDFPAVQSSVPSPPFFGQTCAVIKAADSSRQLVHRG